MIHKYLVNKVRWPIPCSWLLYRRHRKAALLRVIHSGKRQRSGERCCHRRPWHLGQHHAPAEEWHTPPLGILWPVSVVARNRVWILGIQSKQSTGFTSLLYFNEINSPLVSGNHTHSCGHGSLSHTFISAVLFSLSQRLSRHFLSRRRVTTNERPLAQAKWSAVLQKQEQFLGNSSVTVSRQTIVPGIENIQ